MATTSNRTGTGYWQRIRKTVLNDAQESGLTHCPMCRVELDYVRTDRPPNHAEVDHIVPHSRGGGDERTNLQVICRRCNQSKGNRTKPATKPVDPDELRDRYPLSRHW